MAISPRHGETVYLGYRDIHCARLRLGLADGTRVSLEHGDALLDQLGYGWDGVFWTKPARVEPE